jgi:hypothetical protein
MLKKVVKVYTHRLRGLDIQLIPAAEGGVVYGIVEAASSSFYLTLYI